MDKVTGFEIPVGRMKRAQKFFKKAFGWKSDIWDNNHAHLKTVEMDKDWVPKIKGAVNGMMFKKESRSDKPLLIITVPSIDESIKKIKKANGKIVTPKSQAGEWGYWAEIRDTEGNIFELWEDME